LLCLAVSACANRPAPPDPSPYDESAYQPYALAGTATVTGSSFLITRSGDVKKGAARQVFLIPDTPFVRARMREDDKRYSTFEWLGFGRTDPAVIVTAWKHTRTAVGDVDGKFTFAKVPAGAYFVETKLIWQYISCGLFRCGPSDTGSVLRQRIEVQDGEKLEVQLTTPIPQ
jgi:hypothetical protein